MAVETNCGHNQQLMTRRSTKGGKGDTRATRPKVDNNRRNTRCKDEIKKFGNKLYEYCFGEYDDEEQDIRIKTNERHYYRAKMEFLNRDEAFEKYYRFGITSTQTSEIINGAPGAARSLFGGNWRYYHPVNGGTDGESEPDYDGKEQEDEGSGSLKKIIIQRYPSH